MPDFLDTNLAEIPDLAPVEPGEYELTLIKAETKSGVGKTSGKPYKAINCVYDVVGEPEAETIFHMLFFPADDADEKQKIRSYGDIKKWIIAHGFDPSDDFGYEDMHGSVCSVLLTIEEYEGRGSNKIKTFVNSA